MKLRYYAETDSLYIDLNNRPGSESKEIATGVVVDFDDAGNIVGIDIDRASKLLDLSELSLDQLPTKSQKISA